MSYLPISSVAEYAYCPRSAMHYLVGTAADHLRSAAFVSGVLAHRRAHDSGVSARAERQQWRNVPLVHEGLRLIGRADLVERDGLFLRPVEFKPGAARPDPKSELQVVLQALCLEAMTGKRVRHAAVYFARSNARRWLQVDAERRRQAVRVVQDVRAALEAGDPRGFTMANDARCRQCSFLAVCLPPIAFSFFAEERHAASR